MYSRRLTKDFHRINSMSGFRDGGMKNGNKKRSQEIV